MERCATLPSRAPDDIPVGVSEPLWLRSAALTATLAGLTPTEAVVGFGAMDGEVIARSMRSIAESITREGLARVVCRERVEGRRGPADGATRARCGARVLAAWLRALSAGDRARWVRALEPRTLKLVVGAATDRTATEIDARVLNRLMARVVEAIGRAPTAEELGGVLAGWLGDDGGVSALLARVARTSRVLASEWGPAIAALCASGAPA